MVRRLQQFAPNGKFYEIVLEYNPIAIFVYFLCAAMLPMFCMNPAILVFSLAGAVCFYFVRNGLDGMRSHLFFLALLLVMSLINPLFYHNGETVLFVLNDNPVTLEALCYGIASSVMIIGVLYWFRSFSQLMTEDRLLYLMGSASPKLALVLSMALRYVPLFGRQTERSICRRKRSDSTTATISRTG